MKLAVFGNSSMLESHNDMSGRKRFQAISFLLALKKILNILENTSEKNAVQEKKPSSHKTLLSVEKIMFSAFRKHKCNNGNRKTREKTTNNETHTCQPGFLVAVTADMSNMQTDDDSSQKRNLRVKISFRKR